uniref:Large ribosomal subunit protein uL16m n=1 Tax=Chloroparvula japonica TaxID=1411623 RepID=A0A4D6C558_9CHLO|nr:ribosomal protein L16 [Chloroparvula japonica]QBX98780.1 ribosomal protein L16 [Chloroparvula japonica]
MLSPKRTKYRKTFKRFKKTVNRVPKTRLTFGSVGLRACSSGLISARALEAARRCITRSLKRTGQVWTCVFPDKPITRKPSEVRMGRGKGSLDHWAAFIRPGMVLFEIDGVRETLAAQALVYGSHKLGLKTQVIYAVPELSS